MIGRPAFAGAALLAWCCFGAISATSSLALSGEIVNSSGNALVKNKFSGSSAVAGKLETVAGSKVECEKASTSGTITSKTTGTSTMTFTGCETGGSKCKTSGAANAGEIIFPFKLKPVIIGMFFFLLKTLTNSSFEPATGVITCSSLGVTVEVKGSFLIPVGPLDTLKTEFEFNAKGSKGVQEPAETENKLEAKFSNSASKAFEGASVSQAGVKVKYEEEVKFI